MADPIEPVGPASEAMTARDEGGEAPCFAHLLEEQEQVTDVPAADVDPASDDLQ